jgi:hypothetical protein
MMAKKGCVEEKEIKENKRRANMTTLGAFLFCFLTFFFFFLVLLATSKLHD